MPLDGSLQTCDAATDCAALADGTNSTGGSVYYSFDLHFLASNASWECVLYYDPNNDTADFNVVYPDSCLTLGYSGQFPP